MVRRKEGMGKEGRERGRGGKEGNGREEKKCWENQRGCGQRVWHWNLCSHPRYGKNMVIGWVTEWLSY